MAQYAARARCLLGAFLTSLTVTCGFRLIVSDSRCQIFHHASPIPGSRIHSWPVLVDNGIGFLSVRTRGDSVLACMCNAHLVPFYAGCSQVLACMWDRPSGPAKLNSDCQPLLALVAVRLDARGNPC